MELLPDEIKGERTLIKGERTLIKGERTLIKGERTLIKGERTFSTFNGYILEVERHFDLNFS